MKRTILGCLLLAAAIHSSAQDLVVEELYNPLEVYDYGEVVDARRSQNGTTLTVRFIGKLFQTEISEPPPRIGSRVKVGVVVNLVRPVKVLN